MQTYPSADMVNGMSKRHLVELYNEMAPKINKTPIVNFENRTVGITRVTDAIEQVKRLDNGRLVYESGDTEVTEDEVTGVEEEDDENEVPENEEEDDEVTEVYPVADDCYVDVEKDDVTEDVTAIEAADVPIETGAALKSVPPAETLPHVNLLTTVSRLATVVAEMSVSDKEMACEMLKVLTRAVSVLDSALERSSHGLTAMAELLASRTPPPLVGASVVETAALPFSSPGTVHRAPRTVAPVAPSALVKQPKPRGRPPKAIAATPPLPASLIAKLPTKGTTPPGPVPGLSMADRARDLIIANPGAGDDTLLAQLRAEYPDRKIQNNVIAHYRNHLVPLRVRRKPGT